MVQLSYSKCLSCLTWGIGPNGKRVGLIMMMYPNDSAWCITEDVMTYRVKTDIGTFI